jgi:hypothetical protein
MPLVRHQPDHKLHGPASQRRRARFRHRVALWCAALVLAITSLSAFIRLVPGGPGLRALARVLSASALRAAQSVARHAIGRRWRARAGGALGAPRHRDRGAGRGVHPDGGAVRVLPVARCMWRAGAAGAGRAGGTGAGHWPCWGAWTAWRAGARRSRSATCSAACADVRAVLASWPRHRLRSPAPQGAGHWAVRVTAGSAHRTCCWARLALGRLDQRVLRRPELPRACIECLQRGRLLAHWPWADARPVARTGLGTPARLPVNAGAAADPTGTPRRRGRAGVAGTGFRWRCWPCAAGAGAKAWAAAPLAGAATGRWAAWMVATWPGAAAGAGAQPDGCCCCWQRSCA